MLLSIFGRKTAHFFSEFIKEIKGVVNVIAKDNQCQVVIGQEVNEYFDTIMNNYPALNHKKSEPQKEEAKKEKRTILNTLFDTISGIFVSIKFVKP